MVDMIAVNPLAIEICLNKADFDYPFKGVASFGKGWNNFPVIPALYRKFCELGRPLFPDEAMKYLMDHCDPRYRNDETVKRRGQKLYLDSCRELHTWGLLLQCPVLASVRYQKALDIKMGVDFLASLLLKLRTTDTDMIAIQSMMRGNFPPDWTPENDRFNTIKRGRQQRRNNNDQWNGPIFYLTNKKRPYYKSIHKCWLFGPQHIFDLAEELKSNSIDNDEEAERIAIQAKFDF
jgi:uncharacterized phage-associated protein